MIDEEIDGILGEADSDIGGEKYDKEVEQPTKVKIWIDDIRQAPDGYVWIKTVNDFVDYVEKNGLENVGLIDTDHDAGDYYDFGGDYIRCFDYLRMIGAKDLTIHIHSANPVGENNIRQIISRCSDDGWKEVRNTSESDTDGKMYAYHVSNTPPETIRKEGFRAGLGGGATENNLFEDLYREDYPKNYLFVSKEPWDSEMDEKFKYCYKLDITNLDLYPDFGMLLENGAYYDENFDEGGYDFWWKDRDIDFMKNKKLKELIVGQGGVIGVNEMMGGETVDGEYFPHALYEALGSAVVDADVINKENRIVAVERISGPEDGATLTEDKKAYLKKYEDEPNVVSVVDKFWNEIRKKAKGQEKDIEYWYKKPFKELEQFVTSFDTRSRKDRKTDEYVRIAEENGAQVIGEYDGYELWFIPTHEAARQIGRFYRGKSCEWCVSTDNGEYFNDHYKNSNFVFAIRKEFQEDNFDKLAFEIPRGDGEPTVWSLDDDNVTETLPDGYVDDVKRIFQRTGLDREDFLLEFAETKCKDAEWLEKELFEDLQDFKFEDGIVEGRIPWNSVDSDIIDHRGGEDLSYWEMGKILNENDAEMFDTFDSNDWDDILKYSDQTLYAEVFDEELSDMGLTWKELKRDFMYGNSEYGELFNEDYCDGVSFHSIYSDCQITGRMKAARDYVVDELKDKLPITEVKTEDDQTFLYVSVGGDALKKMTFMRLDGDERSFFNLYLEWLDETIRMSLPQEVWEEFDNDKMEEATKEFAKNIRGLATKQKDLEGQQYFEFDKDYNKNPRNVTEDDGFSSVDEAIERILG